MSLTRGQLKAIVMAIMAPNGTAANMNEHMFGLLWGNAEKIVSSCMREEKVLAADDERVAQGKIKELARERANKEAEKAKKEGDENAGKES